MVQLAVGETAAVTKRLHRVQGQIGGILRMLEDGRDCEEIVTQIAAASKALERSGYAVIAAGLQQCVAPGSDATVESQRLQRLFLSLA